MEIRKIAGFLVLESMIIPHNTPRPYQRFVTFSLMFSGRDNEPRLPVGVDGLNGVFPETTK